MSGQPGYDPLISADYNGWWQRGIAIVKAAWRPLVTLQAIGLVVGLAVRWPAAIFQATVTINRDTGTANLGRLFGSLAISFVGLIAAALVSMVVTLAIVHVTVVAATGEQPNVGDALRLAVKRLLPLIGWGLLAGLIVFVGLCACILPGIYFYAVFVIVPPVVMLERTNVIARCFKLFHGNIGASLARVATIIGITLVVGFIVGAIGGAIGVAVATNTASTGGRIAADLVSTTLGIVASAALGVLLGPLTVLAYADMRARVEQVNAGVVRQELNQV
jgi:hypothetical protein